MDSRVRRNDEVNAGIPAENKFSIFCKTGNISFPRTRRNSAKKPRHSRETGIYSGILILEFREFYAKIKFEIPVHFFFAKNEVNAGVCR